ncbi:HAD family hydrolase [Psychrobacter pygoscelis]|uniref:HAD family hydrolase n=1 Tax=Psychrobacter pygoscelis TaxID=2488563 RepID=UPI00103EE2AC|nr:HAD family hydrolase [Psychrobacter pygoscelis]
MTLLSGSNDYRNQDNQPASNRANNTELASESAKVVGDLAIFDLDHTLLGGDSNMIWTDYLYERGLVDDSFISQRDKFFADYKAGSLDFTAYMAHMFTPFARFDYQTLCRYRDDCFKTQVAPKLYPQGRELVEAHRQAGDTLLIISATNEFLIEPVCRALGVSEIIGVQLERSKPDNTDNANNANSNFTGKHIGTPSFGAGKQVRLEQWLDNQGRELSDYGRSYFYSDSINDAPLLETVTDAITVNPDDKLKALAQTRGWQVLNFE